MKVLTAATAIALGVALPQLASAQSSAPATGTESGSSTAARGTASAGQSGSPNSASDSWRMPYQKEFWGHGGISVGRSRLNSCPGIACDRRDNVWRIFGGGRFNNTFGFEAGWLDLGDFSGAGGATSSQGLDLAVTAGVPIGSNSSVFGKVGAAYMRNRVSGTAPGLVTGTDRGWGPRIGLGAQVGLSQNWALRADIDRYRLDMPGGDRNVDTFTVGAQFTFR